MSDILNTYPVFERNQVLTSTQLNHLVSYLDQQNRLTRARLIGMGIVCGLEVNYDTGSNTITISKGTGITSEGYLINIGECITIKYRPYILPPGTVYEPFVNAENKQDITLFELLTDDAKSGADDKLLNDNAFLADKVVLLFIESFDKDLKSCLGKNCDELGKERILTLRKLLISKTDLQKVRNRTNTGKLDAVFPEKYKLPVVNLPRVLFNPASPHSVNYNDFSKNYADAVLSVFDKLVDALVETYDIYRPLLLKSYNEKNPFENNPVANKLAKLQNFLNNTDASLTSWLGVQYVYDLFQDLILGYNEFKNTAFDLMSECSADMSRFPKHLMLGEVIPPASVNAENSEYRHHFIQPPIYNLQKLLVKRTISLHNRLVLMLESFDLKRINGFKGADGKSFPVKITPSLEKTTLLSQRSIPWYYDLKKKSSYTALGTLKNYWNFDVSRKNADEAEGLILNYEDQSNDQSTPKNKLATPLFFDIQDYPFLRIEGQIGTDFNLALERIDKLKTQFNLPFNTVALQLDPNAATLQLDYKCGFEDIQEEYKFLKMSFCRFVGEISEMYVFIKENRELLFDGKENETQSELLKKLEEMVEILVKLCKSLPDCFSQFNFAEFQEGYKLLLERIISFVLIDFKLLEKINISRKDAEKQVPLINGFIQRVSPVVNSIFDLFFYNRFLRLFYSFKRREFYLQKTTGVFSGYISKHPGAEHQAGVQKGGTFILVYVNNANKNVIADFSLPYLCCSTDNCVPMCDNESGFVFESNPFARPDYAITVVDMPVEIDVLRNDTGLFEAELVIKSEEVSKEGGTIKQTGDKTPLLYSPAKGFIGTDYFGYSLFNAKTGTEDKAVVTIVVKKAEEQQKPCYTVEILQCWGEKSVMETLRRRGIQFTSNDNIYELLLADLRKTGGFTEAEIRGNVLESAERRRALLSCLGIPTDDSTTYDQLGQLILDYQKSNCGAVQPAKTCYTIPILQCWGEEAVKDTIGQRELDIPAGASMFEVLLTDLRKTGGFTESEIFSSVLEEEDRRRKLLGCLGINTTPNTTYAELGELILQYQKQNCGSATASVACYSVEIFQCWGEAHVQRALKLRQIDVTGNIFQALLSSLMQTHGFSLEELEKMGDARINELLKCMQITVPTNKKPVEVIIEFQLKNCQGGTASPAVTVDPGLLTNDDLKKILVVRRVNVSEIESRTEVESALVTSKTGSNLTEVELAILPDETITKILNNKNIVFEAGESKSQRIRKIFNR